MLYLYCKHLNKPKLPKCLEASIERFFILISGIFSDTHLLALMYSGELCYWHWKIVKETTTDQSVKESSDADENCSGNFNSVSNGRRLLQKFVNIVQDCFKGRGWDCSRAEQILAEFPEC